MSTNVVNNFGLKHGSGLRIGHWCPYVVARQPPGAYDVRTASTYGTGHTTAPISVCTCSSTVGLAVPPSSSPQTNVTSVPGSACSASRTARVSILPSFELYAIHVETPTVSPSTVTLSYWCIA